MLAKKEDEWAKLQRGKQQQTENLKRKQSNEKKAIKTFYRKDLQEQINAAKQQKLQEDNNYRSVNHDFVDIIDKMPHNSNANAATGRNKMVPSVYSINTKVNSSRPPP